MKPYGHGMYAVDLRDSQDGPNSLFLLYTFLEY